MRTKLFKFSQDNYLKMDKIKKIVLKVIFTSLAAFFGLLLLAAILLNILTYSFAENIVENYTGLKIEFVKPKSTISSSFNINIKADEINLYNKKKQKKKNIYP